MKKEFTYPSKDGKTSIHAIEWIPETEVRAMVQISHGMVEFIGRYDRLARYLNENGIYVAGNDHLGHGASVISEEYHGYFAEPDGNACVIGDMRTLQEMMRKKYPGLPYFLYGHSMGSFLVRQYIELYPEDLKGIILSGTAYQTQGTLTAAKTICRTIALFKGWKHRSDLVNNMALGSYNKPFEPGRTACDWLSRDHEIVDAYVSNPWDTFKFTLNGYYNLSRGLEYAEKEENIRKIPKDLPMLIASGGKDPVGECGKGPARVADIYKSCGMQDVTLKIYPDDRHEIHNELDYETVYQDYLNWIREKMNG